MQEVLKAAMDAKRRFTVYVTESRPDAAGWVLSALQSACHFQCFVVGARYGQIGPSLMTGVQFSQITIAQVSQKHLSLHL